MEISTRRLLLREYGPGDLDAVHAFASDPVVCAFAEWGPNTPQDTAAFLEECAVEQVAVPRKTWTFAIVWGGSVIGSVALMTGKSDLVHEPGEAELGYVLHRNAWGNGYAAETAEALLAWAGGHLGITRVVATCRPENTGSVRVLEKIGMQQVDHLHEHKRIDGKTRDSLVFAGLLPVGEPAGTSAG
ncbi:GNAT family N-acetyltransferase [Paeniglutamicibacter psychrophenolicus]|uniref:GNAT family N-acetyltransferase n=1 Tax=Paeniglutamicibacter psychrophenolicus TaxID=257454 RepID=UPI0027803CB1|nr:GNAT family N-acetyltransferase [Paeniglutamicibacter psychrophenolicus]MDQ0096254.1 RimJ/RimL family protein N-acetyltransferase [Paeniglutamicibacter psychrophenolicus]